MKRWFAPNLETKGRLARGLIALALAVGAALVWGPATWQKWTCAGMAVSSLFVLFEALRGWCLARACGIRTRL